MAKVISYDRENDILVMHKGFSQGEKFRGNIEIGDLVLDVSTKMRIRGIEILNASEYLKEFIGPGLSGRTILNNMKDISFDSVVKGESMTLSIMIKSVVSDKEKNIPAKIAVPIGTPLVR